MSRSRQCSTTGVTKAVVCVITSSSTTTTTIPDLKKMIIQMCANDVTVYSKQ